MVPAHCPHDLIRIGDWLDIEWSDLQMERLERYERWLGEEAVVAGGIGPGEVPRLFDRHIADSLAFLRLIDEEATSLIDVGSGVGLPGIPIAIARPQIDVTVLDRSERKTHLAARAARILTLDNISIVNTDVAQAHDVYDIVVFRASLPIESAVQAYQRLASPGGVGIFAWSRLDEPKSPPESPTDTIFRLTPEGVGVLESPAWLLRMQRSP
jgi:16S rRNA (guanine(527)-N(7))-methyltransferase RsmG